MGEDGPAQDQPADTSTAVDGHRGWGRVIGESLAWATAVGVLAGALWGVVADPLRAVVQDGSLVLGNDQDTFADDGAFALLALAAGTLVGALLSARHRRAGPVLPVALAAGGILGSLVAWWAGVALGPDDPGRADVGSEGATVELPYELGATGILLFWSIAAVAVALLVTALDRPRPTAAPVEPADDGPGAPQ